MEDFKLRILLCFYKRDGKDCTVTELAKTLVVEKYVVSRAMATMEKEGLINRTDQRKPYITDYGMKVAQKYQSRLDVAMRHLLYEGVGNEAAYKDAWLLARECSDETFSIIGEMEEKYRVKYELRNRTIFKGSILCSKMKDGTRSFPFIIYNEEVVNGTNISCVNYCFEHPCELKTWNGAGVIRLKTDMHQVSKGHGIRKKEFVKDIEYYDGDKFCKAEKNGVFFQFPAEMFNFTNVGSDNCSILHGSIVLKIHCYNETCIMSEKRTIFTIII